MSKKANKTKKVAIEDIVIRYDLYPRLPQSDYDSSQSEQAIQSYKMAIENLPPIVINQDNILIDGWHRWQAYKRIMEDIELGMLDDDMTLSKGFDAQNIEVEVVQLTEEEILLEAARLNSRGQVVMSREEKRRVAEKLCANHNDNDIADALDVPRSTVNYWTKKHREQMTLIAQELVFQYADEFPDMKQTEIRNKILEEHGVTVPRSTHSDWLRDREAIEESWKPVEPEEEEGEQTDEDEGMTYGEYVGDAPTVSATTIESTPDTLAPSTSPDTNAYICDGYKPTNSAISDKEYFQTGCLRCKNLKSAGTVGWEITVECGKGHQMCVTGLKRDR